MLFNTLSNNITLLRYFDIPLSHDYYYYYYFYLRAVDVLCIWKTADTMYLLCLQLQNSMNQMVTQMKLNPNYNITYISIYYNL